jgi:molybdate transport system ATP-binding protein
MANSDTIEIQISKQFKSKQINNFQLDVDTTIPSKGITAIFGKSGSGKTSLLRCIGGLEPSLGKIVVNDHRWQDRNTSIPTHKRPIGFVFQDSRLFPHLDVRQNLEFASKRAMPKDSSFKIEHILQVLGIEHLLARKPETLSGGEKQRVAIARALLIQPKLLLMDEPLASLDKQRKQEVIPYISKVSSEFCIPVLYVTHSIDEVSKLADRVIILENGRISAHGTVANVFSDLSTFDYLHEDSGVIINGVIGEVDETWGLASVIFDKQMLWIHNKNLSPNSNLKLRILARDVSISLSPANDSSILNKIPATIDDIRDTTNESMTLVRLKVGSSYIISCITRRSVANLKLTRHLKVWAQIKSVAILD